VDVLLEIKQAVDDAKLTKSSSLTPVQIQAFEERYDALLQQGFQANPLPEAGKDQPKKRGRPKRSPPLNLLDRFREHESAIRTALSGMYLEEIPGA
jgi:hypothetical protein